MSDSYPETYFCMALHIIVFGHKISEKIFGTFGIGEIEMYHKLLNTARLELEPWEKHIIECESKIGVTSAASKLLKDKVSIFKSKVLLNWQIYSSIADRCE